MSNKMSNTNYDLEERTGKFGEDIIKFANQIPKNEVTKPLISQLVRAGTSVGANYCEADCAETKKDFEHKIGICKKESKETKHWLRMIAEAVPNLKENCRTCWREATELNLIFCAIVNKSRKNRIETD
jgi:four helix bundle protein